MRLRLGQREGMVFMDVVLLSEVVVVVEVLVLAVQSRPDEPSNISVLSAFEVIHTPQSVCANDEAERNMKPMLATLDTSHFDMSPLNKYAERNMLFISVTLDTSHLDMSPLNDDAEWNMFPMVVTLDMSHLEMSPLNDAAE